MNALVGSAVDHRVCGLGIVRLLRRRHDDEHLLQELCGELFTQRREDRQSRERDREDRKKGGN